MNHSMQTQTRTGRHRWRLLGWSAVAVLLIAPLVAMQFTDEVNWTASDFLFAAVLLVGTGVIIELTLRLRSDWFYRAGVITAVVAALLIVWLTGAVGIIGSEAHSANLLFFGLLAVVVLMAIVGRLRPRGMALAMLAGAVIQIGIGLAAALAGWGELKHALVLNGFFALLWLLSAGLFRRAAADTRQQKLEKP